MKSGIVMTGTVFLLSLATWILFDLSGVPLDGPQTTVVVAAYFICALVVRFFWLRSKRGKTPNV